MHSRETLDYLESKILTAAPHRLHLMLVEGAIRFGRQAEVALRQGDTEAAGEPLMRTVDIVGELLVGLRSNESEMNRQFVELYAFLFRSVAAAKINNDANLLADALRLLEYERQTWQAVCDRDGSEASPEASGPMPNLRPHTPIPAPHQPSNQRPSLDDAGAGFSCEA